MQKLNLNIKNSRFILIFLILIFAVFVRVFAFNHFEFIQQDVPFSFSSATIGNKFSDGSLVKTTDWNNFNFKNNIPYSGYEIKKAIFESNQSVSSILNDLKLLRTQNLDKAHTNFYFSIQRIWMAGCDEQNYKTMMVHALYLNLIFFIISFFFMYKLLCLIKNDTKFITLALFFMSFCAFGMTCILFVREYNLAGMFFIIAAYYGLKTGKSIYASKDIPVPLMIKLSLSFIFSALTGYYNLLYIGLIIISLLFCCYKNKSKKALFKILFSILLSIVSVYIIYPLYGQVTNSDCNDYVNGIQEKIRGLFYFLFFGFINLLKIIKDNIIYPLIILALLILTVCNATVFKKKLSDEKYNLTKEENNIFKLVILLSLLWTITIITINPITSSRFLLPIYPFICLILVYFCYRYKNIVTGLIVLIYLALSTIPIFFNIQNKIFPRIDGYRKSPITTLYVYSGERYIKSVSEQDKKRTITIENNHHDALGVFYFKELKSDDTVIFTEEK